MEVLYLMVLHFIADFLLQSKEMGKKKSECVKWLAAHIGIHFITFFAACLLFLSPEQAALMAFGNAALHGLIDWNLWRFYKRTVVWRNPDVPVEELKKNYKWWEDFVFIVALGLDQMLHYLSIVTLYNLIV